MADFNLEDCLRDWLKTYGIQQSSKAHGSVYWKIKVKERRYYVNELIKVLRSKGMEREWLEKHSFVSTYLSILFGEAPWADREKKKSAFAAAHAELLDVISDNFRVGGDFGKVEIPDAPPAAQPRQKIVSSSAPEKLEPKTPSQPLSEMNKLSTEPDRSLLKSLPPVETLLDEDFAKFLGVTEDE